MADGPPLLVEFPADDVDRATRFWDGVLDLALEERRPGEGEGLQSRQPSLAVVGVHARGPGPGDRGALPYFLVPDLEAALARVAELGGTVVHPGARWAVCRDSEGNPFGLGRA